MTKPIDLKGSRYGRLTVLYRASENDKHGNVRWVCQCDCGNESIVSANCLRMGHTKSCGCLTRETSANNLPDNRRHMKSRTRLYKIWDNMRSRCYNPKHKSYSNYGGRGITICEEWRTIPDLFFEWAMNNGYSDTQSIDRIDNNGPYSPDNCRWVAMEVQAQNKRNIVYIETEQGAISLKKAAELHGLPYAAVHWRYKNGFPLERLFEPIAHHK